MNENNQDLQTTCDLVKSSIQNLLAQKKPIVIALDGGSGAGKSTLAPLIAAEFEAALIPLDDFFSAHIPDIQWDQFSVEEKLKNVFDWNRVRQQVIEPLLKGQKARWQAFDFTRQNPDGTYQMQTDVTERAPAEVILIDGAYSTSHQLADLIDLKILIEVPLEERHQRVELREKDKDFLAQWHQRWDPVEKFYFTRVRPPESFDLVIKWS